MSDSPRPLASLDPRSVPLPHGTEVSLRVDRLVGERRVPQGSLGRVVKTSGDMVEVMIVGVGTALYRRDEVMPRKVGQEKYALRRAADWEALTPCVVLQTTVGSRAWGLSDEGSDLDVRGLFALPLSWTLGLAEPPRDLVSVDGSATYWEVGKAIRQALRADPNTLETLFVPSATARDEIGAWILEARDAFVSSEIYGSFGQYALAQLRKLTQSLRLAEHRAVVLEWLREETPPPDLDEVARRLSKVGRPAPSEADAILQAKEYVKQLYRSMYDQGLIASKDFASLTEFARSKSAQLELPRELRPKNAYNLLRLISTATEWLRTGTPRFEMTGALRERLLAIKRGEVPLGEVLADAERMTPELEEAYRSSPLPKKPDVARADALLRRVGEEVARRWVRQEPGPWGVGAPPHPEVTWSSE
jgi:hypothetical protein